MYSQSSCGAAETRPVEGQSRGWHRAQVGLRLDCSGLQAVGGGARSTERSTERQVSSALVGTPLETRPPLSPRLSSLTFTFSHLSRATYSKCRDIPPKASRVKCLAQGHNVIWHGRESNWQPSDYQPDSLTAQPLDSLSSSLFQSFLFSSLYLSSLQPLPSCPLLP